MFKNSLKYIYNIREGEYIRYNIQKSIMVKFLADLIAPMLYARGVSEADFNSYVGLLSPYINAILIFLLAFVIAIVVTFFIKKGIRAFVRMQALVAFLLAIVVIVNIISFGPMYNNIKGILNNWNVKVSDESRANSKEIVGKVGEEGFVLLKNNGLLPLKDENKNINVFGWASIAPIFGGTGSGSSDTTNNIGILESLKNAGFNTNEDLTQMKI